MSAPENHEALVARVRSEVTALAHLIRRPDLSIEDVIHRLMVSSGTTGSSWLRRSTHTASTCPLIIRRCTPSSAWCTTSTRQVRDRRPDRRR